MMFKSLKHVWKDTDFCKRRQFLHNCVICEICNLSNCNFDTNEHPVLIMREA